MKTSTAIKFIESELRNLDIDPRSPAWRDIFENALAASDILTRKALRKYIEEKAETFSLEERFL